MKFFKNTGFILALLFLTSINQFYSQETKVENKPKFSFRDSLDGAIDLSKFLINPKGFMPVPIIITEPAIGYGGGLVALFFHPQKKEYDVNVPPNISGLAGFATTNKTWMAAAFHFHVWGPDKIRYLSAVAKPNINIKYYGNNSDFLSKNPIEFNLDAFAVIQRVNVRLAKSDLFLGGAYVFFQGETKFEPFPDNPIFIELLSRFNGKTTMSMLQPMANWDSRNNIFTPNKGLNTGFIFSYNATWLGGDENFYKLNPYFLGYKPISETIFSGFRMDSQFMIGDSPFYAKPFINMRGVPAMKYQSDNTILVETEWKFKVYKRWSIDTFVGSGKAFESFDSFGAATWVYSYGLGFRYTISRLFGIDAGMDFAWSNNGDFGFSIVFGSAWSK